MNAVPRVKLSRAVTIPDEPCYVVLIDGRRVGMVRRDENVTATYWGAWRGGLIVDDDEDGVWCWNEPVRAQTRKEAVAEVVSRFLAASARTEAR